MADYYEIDFLNVESPKSGDAITIRYSLNGNAYIHVVDAGFQDTGQVVVDHIHQHYGRPAFIDHVVVTHPDGDHAGGLRTVLELLEVGALWMFRPWQYAQVLLPYFENYTSEERLARRLKEVYPNLAALEDIALAKGIPIYEPQQGRKIGAFTVLAPSLSRFLQLVIDSEKTPEAITEAARGAPSLLGNVFAKIRNFVKGLWGHEVFSPNETSAENEMSVVQFSHLCGKRILLTADAGRGALSEAADFASLSGIPLPGLDVFQVPHHGSRRNVSTEILDRWLGVRLPVPDGLARFYGINSSSRADEDHPRRSVIRAIHHRGGHFLDTRNGSIRAPGGAPPGRGWGPAIPTPYPDEQEE